MKVVFIMRHSGYIRNFESVLRLLCERGHHVHVAYHSKMREWLLYTSDIGQQLSGAYTNFSQGVVPGRSDGWGLLGHQVRFGLDYLRYLAPVYRNAPRLRRRVERDVAEPIVRIATRGPASRKWLARSLRFIDQNIPRSAEIDRFIDEQRPDLLLLTPLVEPGSVQTEYVRSARARGVRTVFCVASWDNLTNKGVIHEPVDLVTVWNADMKREAVELHGVPPEHVAVTGAQPFDHWFGWKPSTSRDTFCTRVGLSPDQPYLLYLCSSRFVAADEAPFVRKWVEQLRQSSSEALRRAGVLVRPHPQNVEQWHRFDATGLGNFTVYPAAGASPVNETTKADYFDSIYHGNAVVGINTTAEIESAIVGRKVYTILAPEFRDTQDGTLHFQHLKRANGGLVQVATNFPDHLAQLEAALRDGGDDDGRVRRFVESFVRPYGIDVPATPKFVEALERLAASPAPSPVRRWTPTLARPLLWPLAAHLQHQVVAVAKNKVALAAADKARKEKLKADRVKAKKTSKPSRQPKDGADVTKLVAAFNALTHADRVRFVRDIVEGIPTELWFELQRANAEQLDFAGATIQMRVTSKAERVRLRACAKEPWTVEWIQQAVRAGDVLYDIGANVGAYSLIAAKRPQAGARVFAFEASYPNIAALCANIVLNNVATQVTPIPVALSDTTALNRFNLLDMGPGAARHTLGQDESAEGPIVYSQPVMTYRLDDLVAQLGLPSPNHVKLDVDGGELAVLKGAARTLAATSLRSMLIEVSTELSDEITRTIEAHGLRLQSRVRVRNKAGEFRVWYGLFTRPDADLDELVAVGDHVVLR